MILPIYNHLNKFYAVMIIGTIGTMYGVWLMNRRLDYSERMEDYLEKDVMNMREWEEFSK